MNIAERLERLSREVDSALVIFAAHCSAAGRTDDPQQWRRLSDVELRGRRGTIEAFCFEKNVLPKLSSVPLNKAH